MKKIAKKTNMVNNNSLRINYLCPTGMIPVFYNFKQEKKVNRFWFMHSKCKIYLQ